MRDVVTCVGRLDPSLVDEGVEPNRSVKRSQGTAVSEHTVRVRDEVTTTCEPEDVRGQILVPEPVALLPATSRGSGKNWAASPAWTDTGLPRDRGSSTVNVEPSPGIDDMRKRIPR